MAERRMNNSISIPKWMAMMMSTITLLVGVGIAWGLLVGDVNRAKEDIEDLKPMVIEIQKSLARIEGKLEIGE